MADYLRLDKPPEFVLLWPDCSACEVTLELDEDWVCPSCGSMWAHPSNDGDKGTLYEAWSGDALDGDPVSHAEARAINRARDAERHRAALEDLRTKFPGGAS